MNARHARVFLRTSSLFADECVFVSSGCLLKPASPEQSGTRLSIDSSCNCFLLQVFLCKDELEVGDHHRVNFPFVLKTGLIVYTKIRPVFKHLWSPLFSLIFGRPRKYSWLKLPLAEWQRLLARNKEFICCSIFRNTMQRHISWVFTYRVQVWGLARCQVPAEAALSHPFSAGYDKRLMGRD